MDKILFICTDGAAYRNFINAGVVDLLKKKAEIVLVCSEWMLPFLQKKFMGIPFEVAYKPSNYELLVDHLRFTRTIYPATMWPDVRTSTFKILADRAAKNTPLKYYTRRVFAKLTKSSIMQALLKRLSWIWVKQPVVDVFRKYGITKVFSTNMLSLEHIPYVEFGLGNNIPVASFVASWDNLTSKGTPMYLPNVLMMWGLKQKEECINLHHLAENTLRIVGAPQFDSYFNNDVPSKKEISSRLKIPAKSVIITYVGGIPSNVMGLTAENEKVIVETILHGMDIGELPSNSILVIRPHPGVKNWAQYREYEKHSRVRMNYPSWFLDGKDPPNSWNPDWEDHLFMGALMKYSSVAVTAGGSSTLDAAAFGNPAVNVYFDNPPRPYLESLKSHCDFQHLKYIRDFNASPFAENPDELLRTVKDALLNSDRYASERHALLHSLVGPVDGHSAERIVKEILALKNSAS